MNKELEALYELVSHIETEYHSNDYYECTNAKYIIEQALKDKKKQDHHIETLKDRLNNVETTCARYKKALKIIKNEYVDVVALKISKNLEQYNCKEDGRCPLTKKEYELLKEVLL